MLVNISGLVKNSGISSLTSDVEVLHDLQHPPKSVFHFPRRHVKYEYNETMFDLK